MAIDTNLLVLSVFGQVAPTYLGRNKRVRHYEFADYNLLVEVLSAASSLVVIPQCIAEASNLLSSSVYEPLRTHLLLALKAIVVEATELPISSLTATQQVEFTRLGITDAAWLAALSASSTLLTDDMDLYVAALDRGMNAIKFSSMREA